MLKVEHRWRLKRCLSHPSSFSVHCFVQVYGRHGCTGTNKKNEIAVTETQKLSTRQPDSPHPASSSLRVPCSACVADYSHFWYGMVTPLGALVGSSSGIVLS